jgi:nucleotide-binding universal stress UspA family protein
VAVSFTRILAATDGTDAALRGVATAVDLATSFGAELILITAIAVPELVALRLNMDRGALEDHVERTAQKALEAAVTLLREAGVGAEIKVVVGGVPDVILSEIEASGADLVVMGRRSRDEPKEFVLGSVSDRVARQVKVPILLVP